MDSLDKLVSLIDRVTETGGRLLAWLCLWMALLTTTVVVLRYGFNWGHIAMQEAVTYMHGCVFMLGAAYTLKHNEHVRVDIFYRKLSDRSRAWVNSVGGIVFLLPMCAYITGASWSYVLESWSIRETSPEPGGIPGVFLLKSLLPLLAVNLAVQGLAETLRNLSFLIREPS